MGMKIHRVPIDDEPQHRRGVQANADLKFTVEFHAPGVVDPVPIRVHQITKNHWLGFSRRQQQQPNHPRPPRTGQRWSHREQNATFGRCDQSGLGSCLTPGGYARAVHITGIVWVNHRWLTTMVMSSASDYRPEDISEQKFELLCTLIFLLRGGR